MQTVKTEKFDIIGIKKRTSNDGDAARDIPALWGKFLGESYADKISNRSDENIYCLYTNYEGDHTMPYDVILGCKVDKVQDIPEGMTHHVVEETTNAKFLAKGSLIKGKAVIDTWMKIWSADLDRSFQTDYEFYDERSRDMENAEVDIFIALK